MIRLAYKLQYNSMECGAKFKMLLNMELNNWSTVNTFIPYEHHALTYPTVLQERKREEKAEDKVQAGSLCGCSHCTGLPPEP